MEIRSYFNKCNGNLGTNGSVEFLFTKYSVFKIYNNVDRENLELDLIDHGLEEIVRDDENNQLILYCNADSFGDIQQELEKREI